MLTKLGHKYKKGIGWLGNKVKGIAQQGSKVINHPITKGAVALGGLALAGNQALKQKEKNTRFETERNIDESARRHPDEVGFSQTSPSISNYFANPQDMHPDDRKALGYKNGDSGGGDVFNYVFSE